MAAIPRRHGLLVVLVLAALLAALAPTADAQPAAPPDVAHVQGDETVPVYDYAGAIRESIDVTSTLDSDLDGVPDTVRVDIIRPREPAEAGVDVPVIKVASPYYQCCGRGNEGELKMPARTQAPSSHTPTARAMTPWMPWVARTKW